MKKFLFLGLLGLLFLSGLVLIKKEGEKKMVNEPQDLEKKKILMVVAPVNFRDEEFLEPKKVFEENGFQVVVASSHVAEAKGVLGAKAKIDLDLSQVNPQDYQALVFAGGPGASVYFDNQTVLDLVKTAFNQKKVVAAICIAPSILANADLVRGKKVTSWPSEKDNLEAHGGIYTGSSVEVDGNLVTASGPQAAREYGQKIVEQIQSR